MRWFGPPWPTAELRAPVCSDDRQRMVTPVGEPCLYCTLPIIDGDRGQELPHVEYDESNLSVKVVYAHIECLFAQVVGGPAHLQGLCSCQGGHEDPDLGMSPRQAALWVWENISGERGFFKYDDPPAEGRRA